METVVESKRCQRKEERKLQQLAEAEELKLKKNIRRILKIDEQERSPADVEVLHDNTKLSAELHASSTKQRQRQLSQQLRSQEIQDPPGVLASSMDELAQMIREAQAVGGVVVHTGAGLSTAAGIPDFRGPQGVWTLQAKGQALAMTQRYEEVGPTRAHMVIAEMVNREMVRHVVTQNVDGLHLRSGVPTRHLSELHGCVYREQCSACGRPYPRPFDVTQPQGSALRRHRTGRLCEAPSPPGGGTPPLRGGGACGGALVDCIVHFGERLDAGELERARGECKGAYLALGLGSTWKVPPANQLLRLSHKVAIVNLQWTAKDRSADLKIHATLDTVMCQLAERLDIHVAEYDWRTDPFLKESARPPVSPMEEAGIKKDAVGNLSGVKRKGRGSQPSFPRARPKSESEG